jgi:hypothetical protein
VTACDWALWCAEIVLTRHGTGRDPQGACSIAEEGLTPGPANAIGERSPKQNTSTRREDHATPPATKGHEVNGEKRAPPLAAAASGRWGAAKSAAPKRIRLASRERGASLPRRWGSHGCHSPPLSNGQRIRRRRSGSGTETVGLILPGEPRLNGCASEPAEPAPTRT